MHSTLPLTRLASVALGLSALTALTACTSGGTDGATRPPAEVTVTSTTTAPGTSTAPSTTSSSPATASTPSTPSTPSTAASTPTGATTGGQTAPAGRDQSASGLPTCQPSQMSVRVEAEAGGGTAGGRVLDVLASNTGTSQCVTQGYPGISLVAPDSGAQLGAPADRVTGDSGGPLLRLEPGKTAVARIEVAQAANFGSGCAATQAAGFRVYLPGTTAAAYAPYAVSACSAPSVHQLKVAPFTS